MPGGKNKIKCEPCEGKRSNPKCPWCDGAGEHYPRCVGCGHDLDDIGGVSAKLMHCANKKCGRFGTVTLAHGTNRPEDFLADGQNEKPEPGRSPGETKWL